MDLMCRLLVIERKDAIRWEVDPASKGTEDTENPLDGEASAGVDGTGARMVSGHEPGKSTDEERALGEGIGDGEINEKERNEAEAEAQVAESGKITTSPQTDEGIAVESNKSLSILKVVALLMDSSRALTVLFFITVYGCVSLVCNARSHSVQLTNNRG
jgi:hypothetical protein